MSVVCPLSNPNDADRQSVNKGWKIVMRRLILLIFLTLVGCATITRGVEEVFVVESNPVGATVTLVYDEPIILYVEDEKISTRGEDPLYDGTEQKTVMLERLDAKAHFI